MNLNNVRGIFFFLFFFYRWNQVKKFFQENKSFYIPIEENMDAFIAI